MKKRGVEMTCTGAVNTAMDYDLCRYEGSTQLFRGPDAGCRDMPLPSALRQPQEFRAGTGEELAFVGAAEFFGRCVPQPVSDLVAARLGVPTVNLAVHNAGLDVFLRDGAIIDICRRSRATVLQIVGAHNMSNRLYSVHPRRNDRLVGATDMLRALYHDVDFTEFNFTQHMLNALQAHCPHRFQVIEQELQAAWTARMKTLIDRIGGRIVLLWMSEALCEPQIAPANQWKSPLFVTALMVEELRPLVSEIRICHVSAAAKATQADGMVVSAQEADMAASLPGPSAHAEAAAHVIDSLSDLAARLPETTTGPPLMASPVMATLQEPANQSFSTSSGTAVKRSATSP